MASHVVHVPGTDEVPLTVAGHVGTLEVCEAGGPALHNMAVARSLSDQKKSVDCIHWGCISGYLNRNEVPRKIVVKLMSIIVVVSIHNAIDDSVIGQWR